MEGMPPSATPLNDVYLYRDIRVIKKRRSIIYNPSNPNHLKNTPFESEACRRCSSGTFEIG